MIAFEKAQRRAYFYWLAATAAVALGAVGRAQRTSRTITVGVEAE